MHYLTYILYWRATYYQGHYGINFKNWKLDNILKYCINVKFTEVDHCTIECERLSLLGNTR